MTQHSRILGYLPEHRIATSNELRSAFNIVDVPKAVSVLVKLGYKIEAKRNKDGTATYYFDMPLKKFDETEYVFIGNRAILKENIKPKQEEIF